jgi:ABC-type bacteriocin/lantibiotic exporter with double-glycine peptidase domain
MTHTTTHGSTPTGRVPDPKTGGKAGRQVRFRPVRTTQIPQMEDADCGAACLSIILARLGRWVPLHEVRERCGVGRDGLSGVAFARAAASYGLAVTVRVLDKTDVKAVGTVPVPSVMLLDGQHFAVLEGARRGKVLLNDPAIGRLALDRKQYAERASGPVLVVRPTENFSRGGDRWPFARAVGGRIRPYVPVLVPAVLLGVLASVPTVAAAMAVRALLIGVIATGNTSWRWPLLAVLGAAAAFAAVSAWAQQRVLASTLAAMATSYSADYLSRLLRLRGEFFHRRNLGGLVSRAQMNDGLAIALSERIAAPVAAAVTVAGNSALLVWLAPSVAAVVGVACVCHVGLLRLVSHIAGPHQQRLLVESTRRDGIAISGLSMVETIKADGAERWLLSTLAAAQARCLAATQTLASAVQSVLAVSSALGPATIATVAVVGSLNLRAGRVDLGTVLTAQLLAGAVLGPLGAIVGAGTDAQIAKAQTTMLDDARNSPPHPAKAHIISRDEPVQPPPQRLRGWVELRDVSFGYDVHKPPLLRGVSLAAAPGEWVAVVGASGSGKSTLARLIVGALDPWSGAVLLDGVPHRGHSRPTLAASIGYAQQVLRLFEGSLRDNLTLWNPDVPDEAIARALADAQIADVVNARGGVDNGLVEEHGRNLSGGEQQRVELARALVGDPPILVLDEATSALDAETEHAILLRLRARRTTCVFVAHRLSTVRDADLIVVLDKGRVAQTGRYEELIDVEGPYRRLMGGA